LKELYGGLSFFLQENPKKGFANLLDTFDDGEPTLQVMVLLSGEAPPERELKRKGDPNYVSD
jgi:hypothetical protein